MVTVTILKKCDGDWHYEVEQCEHAGVPSPTTDKSGVLCIACGAVVTKSTNFPVYINVYLVEKKYGGPEEGGWWYDEGTPVSSVMVETEESLKTNKELWEEWVDTSNVGRPELSSVRSEGLYELREEEHFAAPFPAVTPHYE